MRAATDRTAGPSARRRTAARRRSEPPRARDRPNATPATASTAASPTTSRTTRPRLRQRRRPISECGAQIWRSPQNFAARTTATNANAENSQAVIAIAPSLDRGPRWCRCRRAARSESPQRRGIPCAMPRCGAVRTTRTGRKQLGLLHRHEHLRPGGTRAAWRVGDHPTTHGSLEVEQADVTHRALAGQFAERTFRSRALPSGFAHPR